MKHNKISSVYICTNFYKEHSLYFKFRGEDNGFGYLMLEGEDAHDLLQEVLSMSEEVLRHVITSSFSSRKKTFTMKRIK